MAEPTFTVYIRLPISRGEFVDPPPIHWDAVKDDELWSIISGAAQTEIDWHELAARFDVTVAFLLQQVAYLTDRHAAQLRAQVRKATAAAAVKTDPSASGHAQPAFGQQQQHQQPSSQDLGSTLRGDPGARRRAKGKHTSTATHRSETSDSSATSSPAFAAGPAAVQGGGDRSRTQQGAGHAGPLSPRRTAELSGKSPSRREGSDGTPSMGSSFSDLDDASVTQSALEEALASKMQDGAIGSRFSISQAFKSRYSTKGSGQR
ncbi:hypothetical protein VdG1_00432 [Verticillium dahliae VDG1]|nr:hypothetical protein VdG1_00432 [Verticillium dahliae VDG1]